MRASFLAQSKSPLTFALVGSYVYSSFDFFPSSLFQLSFAESATLIVADDRYYSISGPWNSSSLSNMYERNFFVRSSATASDVALPVKSAICEPTILSHWDR